VLLYKNKRSRSWQCKDRKNLRPSLTYMLLQRHKRSRNWQCKGRMNLRLPLTDMFLHKHKISRSCQCKGRKNLRPPLTYMLLLQPMKTLQLLFLKRTDEGMNFSQRPGKNFSLFSCLDVLDSLASYHSKLILN
jgi:hypothetical protein